MSTLHRQGRSLTFGIILSALLVAGNAGLAFGHAEHGHPARIHEGRCDDLGRVAFRLNGVGGSVDLDNAPVDVPAEVNPDVAYQVMISETMIDGTIDDLLASNHALMIYESDDEMNAISCGNLGGAMDGDSLITGLAEAGIPGHLGFAIFTPDDDRTHIQVIVGHAMAPISASGASGHADNDDAHAAGDAHDDGAEGGHDAEATPDA